MSDEAAPTPKVVKKYRRELGVMARIVDLLEPLTPAERRRTLDWVMNVMYPPMEFHADAAAARTPVPVDTEPEENGNHDDEVASHYDE